MLIAEAGGKLNDGANVSASPWFLGGLRGPWVGVIEPSSASPLGDVSFPLKDASGHIVAVVAARLISRWVSNDVERLSDALNPRGSAQTLVLDRAGMVMVGPAPWHGAIWPGVPAESTDIQSDEPHFERLPNDQIILVARAPVRLERDSAPGEWQLQLSEPKLIVYQRANALAVRIVWISACLGALTALLGAFGARHLTNRLKQLTRSAAAVGRNEIARIEVPSGQDEVSQLAAAFAKVLDDLRQERSELLRLSGELERRVAIRTREVQRLAEESRYAAVVRERLQIARDLHDTLAHSMMAMLSEVRLLRKLQIHDPAAVPDELARAEEVAQAGLNEARVAITQMRANTARDTGLGPALSKAVERFKDRTGLEVELAMDNPAASFGDERAEVIFRMTEEALRNVERHASASGVRITLSTPKEGELELEVEDDGVGFDADLKRPGHFGLVGLAEQAQLIGANLQILSSPGNGTRLRILLRVAPETL
jgi:signal transduction histidine kinase